MKNKFIVKIAALAAVAVVGLTPLTVSAAACPTNSCGQANQTTCVNTAKSKSSCKAGTCKKNTSNKISKCNKKTNNCSKKKTNNCSKNLKVCKKTPCVVKVTKITCK